MNFNVTCSNNTLIEMIETINLSLNNTVNATANNSDVYMKDFYEDYRTNTRHHFLVYTISYVLAVLIILSNLSVVISSVLNLKKGQKPKSTYLLLGNVSLADTIVGLSIIYTLSNDYILNSNPMCIFQTGILVTPAMVSIFSVGFIAVDRYIYILHGLYYQRWFNTTRVRIGIILIWIISITLGFLPATGWVNRELALTKCVYVGLFPGGLILLNSILSVIPIMCVTILYTFILVKALKTVQTINNTIKIKEVHPINERSNIRMNRMTFHARIENCQSETDFKKESHKFIRSASFNFGTGVQLVSNKSQNNFKSKSTDNISDVRPHVTPLAKLRNNIEEPSKIRFESDFSVYTIDTMGSIQTSRSDMTQNLSDKPTKNIIKVQKNKEPNKWRAIKVVILTTSSLILTWMPFFVTVIFFVFCEDKLTNPKCIRLRTWLGGPLAILAFINSILNPLIYAWWHKGFKRSAKAYYRQYLHKYICHVVR